MRKSNHLRLYKNVDEGNGQLEDTPFVGLVKGNTKVLYASQKKFGDKVKVVYTTNKDYVQVKKCYKLQLSANGSGDLVINSGLNANGIVFTNWEGINTFYRYEDLDVTIEDVKYYAYYESYYGEYYYITEDLSDKNDGDSVDLYYYNIDCGFSSWNVSIKKQDEITLLVTEDDDTEYTLNRDEENDKVFLGKKYYAFSDDEGPLYFKTDFSNENVGDAISNICYEIREPYINYNSQEDDDLETITVRKRDDDYTGPTEEYISYEEGDNQIIYCNSEIVSINVNTPQYCYNNSTNSTLTSITIPDSVTTLEYGEFYACSALTNVVLPDTLTNIGISSFSNCSELTSIIIPDNVTYISDYAFTYCQNLISVQLGKSVDYIGDWTFAGCPNLSYIYSLAQIAPEISELTFGSIDDIDSYSCYTGYNFHDMGINTLEIPAASIGYDTGYWLDPLQNSECCGFNVVKTGENAYSGLDYSFLPETWKIYYTSTDGSVVNPTTPENITGSVINILSNTYENGVGCIIFDGEIHGIGDEAFYGCTGLTSIDIPNSVTSIGTHAFFECTGLTSITIPNGVTSIGDSTFGECKSLTSITIPDSVTSIGNIVFYDCSSLTSIDIPDSVTNIGDYAFVNCVRLTSIKLPKSITSIETHLFQRCTGLTSIDIPDGVTSIGDASFSYCYGLTSVKMPNSIKTIKDNAFTECTGLTSIDIPDGVTSIERYVFYGCTGLTSITIPDGVTSIGSYSFSYCSGLTSINIPDGVTSIGSEAFKCCSSLTSIDIPEGVTSIGEYTFQSCSGLTSIDIPDGVTSIGRYVFDGCTGLTSIDIPEGVTTIGDFAFNYCSGLTSITIPDGVTSIKIYAFYGCTGLTSIDIPNSVTSIGTHAFFECTGLTSINYDGTKEEWNNISKSSYWKSTSITTTVTCTDGTLTV